MKIAGNKTLGIRLNFSIAGTAAIGISLHFSYIKNNYLPSSAFFISSIVIFTSA
jgi:hypothetical protein